MTDQLPLPDWDALMTPPRPLKVGDKVVLVAHDLDGEIVDWCLDWPVVQWSTNGGGAFVEGYTGAIPPWWFAWGIVDKAGR
jgi:hypothetical protein